MRLIAAIAAAAVLAGFTPQVASACGRSDIQVLQATPRASNGYVRIMGELKNGCSVGAIVKLQAIVRREGGEILLVNDFFPADNRLIPAGETYAFQITDKLPKQEPVKLEVKVIDVQPGR